MKNFLKFSSNSLIITTINKQNRNLIKFSEGCLKNNWNFKMPKLITNRGAAKGFKKTATGGFKRIQSHG